MVDAVFRANTTNAASASGAVRYDTGQRLRPRAARASARRNRNTFRSVKNEKANNTLKNKNPGDCQDDELVR